MDGWIRLHRKIMESPVSHDPFLLKLWLLCITKASYRDRDILVGRQTVHIQRGEFVTGRESLAREYNKDMKTSFHVKPLTLWRWLQTLESMGNLNIKTNNKFSLISVVNFDFYNPEQHEDEQQSDQLVNSKRTTNEQLVNTNKKEIKIQGNTEITKDKKIQFAEFVRMTQSEHDKLVDKLGAERTAAYIERLDNYKGAKGKRYASDYRAILTWASKDDAGIQLNGGMNGEPNVKGTRRAGKPGQTQTPSGNEDWSAIESKFFAG